MTPLRIFRPAATLVGALALSHALAVVLCAADEPAFQKTTHVYKSVGDVQIHADVYRPDDAALRPIVVWIHGGGLMMGSREWTPKNLLDLCRTEGFTLASIDYRLAPQVTLSEIAVDLDDALAWVREEGPRLFHIDPERMVIAGGSAGGLCTYLVASRMPQKPKAIVSYWGYGEFDPEWTAVHSTDHGDPVAKDDALKGLSSDVVTVPSRDAAQARGTYYRYLRQNGLWANAVTGLDPTRDRKALERLCPIHHISPEFPPTLMVHGTEDTDVPYACSLRMAEAFRKHGVPHELVTVEGAGHVLIGGDPAKNKQAHDRALAFIREHLK